MKMAAKFVPTQKYKLYDEKKSNGAKYVEENGVKYELDENGEKIALDLYKGTDFEDVVEFLTKNGTKEDRKTFKENCYLTVKKQGTGRYVQKGKHKGKEIMEKVKDAEGKYIMEPTDKLNWLYAKQKFFEEFDPDHAPKAQEKKEPKASLIANW